MEKLEILSRLPLFNGFYGSSFEPDEEVVIEEPYTYDDYDFDYDEYYLEVSKKLTEIIEEKIKSDLGLSIDIEFKKIDSPRFYNYSNDIIEVVYKLDSETKDAIYDKILKNLDDFEGYIVERFTSRSGYIPFYSNKSIDWLKERDNHNFDDYNVISTLLEFLLSIEWVDSDGFYEEVYYELPNLYGSLKTEE